MKYQIVVVVEAEKASEATAKGESIGEVMALQVRPEPQQQGQGKPSLFGQPK